MFKIFTGDREIKQIIRVNLLAGIFILIFGIFSPNCLSYPVMIAPSSSFLLEDSDLAAKGEVISKKEIGTIEVKEKIGKVELSYGECKRFLAVFRIDRVIKGKEIAKAGDEINIELFDSMRRRFEELSEGEYCIVFLKREAENFRFHFEAYSKIPTLRKKAKDIFSKDSPQHRMAEEAINHLSSKDYEIVSYAINDLGYLGIKEALPYLKELEEAEDPAKKGESFAARIRLGDFSCIDKAVQYIEQVPDTRETERAKWRIVRVIRNVRDIGLVPLLNTLSEHPHEGLRESAVYVLEVISDPSSMPYFAKRLRDSNFTIRATARAGMANISKKNLEWPEWWAALEDEDEEKLIKLWEDWWKEEGKEKYLKE